uniref:Uncharacterized protein n=1 Tax=Cacopsylla melanoneura TaxID=428564 RepID=A0A8D8VF90_9HEMI
MRAENFTIRNVFGDLTHQRFTNDQKKLPYMIIRGSKILCSDNTIDLTRFYDMEFMVLLTNQNGTGSNANFLTFIARLFFDSDKTTNIVIKNYLYSERNKDEQDESIWPLHLMVQNIMNVSGRSSPYEHGL